MAGHMEVDMVYEAMIDERNALLAACKLAADALERHVGELRDRKGDVIQSPLGELYAAIEKAEPEATQ